MVTPTLCLYSNRARLQLSLSYSPDMCQPTLVYCPGNDAYWLPFPFTGIMAANDSL